MYLKLLSVNHLPPRIYYLDRLLLWTWRPIGVAHRVYNICKPHKETHYLIPYAMGGYYAYFYARCNSIHMAQYYDVQHGLLMWINGLNHIQLEPVHPDDRVTTPFDCTPLRHSPMAKLCRTRILINEHIMQCTGVQYHRPLETVRYHMYISQNKLFMKVFRYSFNPFRSCPIY